MRIGFDVSQTGRFKMGCGYFAESLARALIADDAVNDYILYPTFGAGYWDPDWPESTLDLSEQGNVRRGLGHRRLDLLEAFWQHPPHDAEVQLGRPDIVHSNNFFCPTGLSGPRIVYTVHDLFFVAHPEWTSEANWKVCFDGVFNASLYADYIVAVSRFTRDQFLELFPHYPPDRISVTYEASRFLGASAAPAAAAVRGLRSGKFWLGVGTGDPRKNADRLLEAYARLKARGETACSLVLFGAAPHPDDPIARSIRRLGLEADVQRPGYLDDASLQWLFENCYAFVYPSLFEGFGLPVVEALSLGAAVITSKGTSLPEVVGDAGVLVDPADVESIAAGMRHLATSQTEREGLRAAGRARARCFSWRAASQDVLDIYARLHSENVRTERKASIVDGNG